MNNEKPLKNEMDLKLGEVRRLTKEESEAPVSSYLVAMANMSRKGASIYQVSVNGGKTWAPIDPPLPMNCQYGSVAECNTHSQYSAIATVNCGYLITLAIRWRMPDGTAHQGQYQGNTLADCNTHKGTLYGFID